MAAQAQSQSGAAPGIAVVGLQIATGLLLTHPLNAVDTVFKVHYQPVTSSSSSLNIGSKKVGTYNNTLDAANAIIRSDGYVGLLRGFVPSFAYSLLYATGFETFYQIYQRVPFRNSPLAALAARDFAAATWRGLLSPLRIITTRLLVRPSARAAVPGPLAFDPFAIWRATTSETERAKPYLLFRPSIIGLEIASALTGQVANSLFAIPVSEIVYAFVTRGITRLNRDEWQQIATLSAVAGAGVIVRLLNVALETVSRRLQAQTADATAKAKSGTVSSSVTSAAAHAEADDVIALRPAPYAGAIDAFRSILDEEGLQGLLRGWGVQLGGTVAISAFTVFLARANGRI